MSSCVPALQSVFNLACVTTTFCPPPLTMPCHPDVVLNITGSYSRHLSKTEYNARIKGRKCGVCGGCEGRTIACSVADCPNSYHILCAW